MSQFVITPAGSLDWLFAKLPKKNWAIISCAGTEDRCLGVPSWIFSQGKLASGQLIIRIDDQPSGYSAEISKRTDESEARLRAIGVQLGYVRGDITSQPGHWLPALNAIAKQRSVVLDITSLPKRFFLYAVKFLLNSVDVNDLVITYTKPEYYPEGQLSASALTPSPIPGFARELSHASESMFFVGVGYVAFNLEELLKQRQGKQIKFAMPFPPGSPAARRNWNLLKQLHPEARIDTEIRRIHSADAFEILRWVVAAASNFEGSIDLIPLGPKPHAIGMALAFLELGPRCQITYAQPMVYRPDYSVGVARRTDGNLDAYAYCLKINGNSTYKGMI
ncbi:hypothetical protein [Xanthomonas tesorieronis]|uniref:hypothetical protein n=1 Tax=Xanthomonas tesorieronis TaxID=3160839 RepID=UPI003514170C